MIYIAADHKGFKRKEQLKRFLEQRDIQVTDITPHYNEHDDYPVIAKELCKRLEKQPSAKGILLCGSGIGMSMAANRFSWIRAALVRSAKEARLAKEHNNANVLVLSGQFISLRRAKRALLSWLEATASKEKRHLRRRKQLISLSKI